MCSCVVEKEEGVDWSGDGGEKIRVAEREDVMEGEGRGEAEMVGQGIHHGGIVFCEFSIVV